MQILFALVAILTITDLNHRETHRFVLSHHLTADDCFAEVAQGEATILTKRPVLATAALACDRE